MKCVRPAESNIFLFGDEFCGRQAIKPIFGAFAEKVNGEGGGGELFRMKSEAPEKEIKKQFLYLVLRGCEENDLRARIPYHLKFRGNGEEAAHETNFHLLGDFLFSVAWNEFFSLLTDERLFGFNGDTGMFF